MPEPQLAVLTGASSGIGREVAKLAAAEECEPIVTAPMGEHDGPDVSLFGSADSRARLFLVPMLARAVSLVARAAQDGNRQWWAGAGTIDPE